MQKKKNRKKIDWKNTLIYLLVLFVIIVIAHYINNIEMAANINIIEEKILKGESIGDNGLKVYFIDVGQADSTLIVCENKTMLIDAGNNEDGKLLVEYIKSLGIEKIDYLVGTHAHEDHIGGLDNIIKSFKIGKVYFPYTSAKTTTMKTFEEIIDCLKEKNLSITTVNTGDKFKVGNAKCEIMHVDNSEPEETNDQSICIRLVYGDQSFLFMGDATQNVENIRDWPKTSVLKVGHHGSSWSSSQSFIEQVNPQIAVISVGKDNDYGHPKENVLKRLKKINAKIYRTDKLGTILISSDGASINVTNFKTNTDGN